LPEPLNRRLPPIPPPLALLGGRHLRTEVGTAVVPVLRNRLAACY